MEKRIIYRTAEMIDLPEICDLIDSAEKEMEKNGIFQWDELYPTKEDFSEDIQNGELFAGTINGKIAVVYSINQSCDEEYKNGKWHYPDESFGVIHRLCVNPCFQRMGIAEKTVLHIEDQFRGQGITAIRLDVFSENPFALRLYEKLGFMKTGNVTWRKGDFFLMEKKIERK